MAEEGTVRSNPSPYVDATVLSGELFMWWLNSLMSLGYRQELQESDIYDVVPGQKSHLLMKQTNSFEAQRKERGKEASLTRCLVNQFWVRTLLATGSNMIVDVLKVIQPYALSMMMAYILGVGDVSLLAAWGWVVLLALSSLLVAIFSALAFHSAYVMGMSCRALLSSLIYKKVLKIGSEAYIETTTGNIINLLSTDVEKFIHAFYIVSPLGSNIVGSCVMFYLLYRDVGWPALPAVGVMALMTVLQLLLVVNCGHLRILTAAWTDKRIQLMSEIISGMKIVKMHCWEKPFHKMISSLRKEEVSVNKVSTQLACTVQTLGAMAPKLVSCTIFIAYVLTVDVLDPIKAIRLVGWCRMMWLASSMFGYVPYLLQIAAGIRRIECFLNLPEHKKNHHPLICDDVDSIPGDSSNHLTRLSPITALEDLHDKTSACFDLVMPELKSADRQIGERTFGELNKAFDHGEDDEALPNSCADNVNENGEPPKELGEVGGNADCDLAAIEVTNLSARWPVSSNGKNKKEDKDVSRFELHSIECNVGEGELVAVVGRVGCGKTSLLMALLGELPTLSGDVHLDGRTAYVSEESWIISDTVRQNVLFGTAMSDDWYKQVIHACALDKDLGTFPCGDLTLVGERGLSLSGGQKARLNLARAVYRNYDIYMLDDPLSAVDAKVAHQIFHSCISGLLKNKTRLLVTHNLGYLEDVDNILVLEEGRIISRGTYQQLREDPHFKSILSQTAETGGMGSLPKSVDESSPFVSNDSGFQPATQMEEQVAEEERGEGSISRSSYLAYVRSGGYLSLILFILTMIIAQVAYMVMDWWIVQWSDVHSTEGQNSTEIVAGTTIQVLGDANRLYIFIGVSLGFVLASIARALILASFTCTASRVLHDAMFAKVLRAHLVFFERNPVGRVLNRFARDTGLMDSDIPPKMHESFFMLIEALGVFIMVCIVNPWLTFLCLPTVILLLVLRQYSMGALRGLRRIESMRRSPLFSQVSATLQGLYTIRSFNMEEQLLSRFNITQDKHTSAWFLYVCAIRWLGVRIDLILAVFHALVLVIAISIPNTAINSVLLSVSLVHILGLFDTHQYAIYQTTMLENLFTSVERIQDYSMLDQEAEEHTHLLPAATWPAKGSLSISHVNLYYKDISKPALKDINISIADKEKIGIVGRTGAGKSSIFTCLLRLVEPEGEIGIDGINICNLGLTDLRRHISVIPQDPVLFTGTLRYNLDPFSEFSDDDKWAALDKVQLKQKIRGLGAGLDVELTEGGSNFSVGERQLMCLARAILECNKILLIDEATAFVDHRTDEIIQQAIREQFIDCTVLTVAHRLNTVIDSDRILVMDEGMVCEFDHPFLLLQKESGILYQMASHGGSHNLRILRELAEHSNREQEHL